MEENTPLELKPALRHLDVRHDEQNGQPGLVLSDPLGLSQQQIFIPNGLLPIVGRFDGDHSIADIATAVANQTGQTISTQLVEGLFQQLDDCGLMEGKKFRAQLAAASQEFLSLPGRPAFHAGHSAGYPGDRDGVQQALESILHRPTPETALRPSPRGLIAPHIDLARGREGYSMAYSALAECEPADLYVVFGTGHQGPQAPVTGLPMDWETPIGSMATDQSYVEAIHKRLGQPNPTDLLLHQREHSLEFQMLFLRQLLGERPCQVAGFLTGHLPSSGGALGEEDYITDMLEAFRDASEAVESSGRRVCYLAGADLAHIGPEFGDPLPIDTARLQVLNDTERQRLEHLERGDPSAFHAAVEQQDNPDRVCGTTPMFLAASLAGGPGRLLHYGQASADAGQLTVSYCAMVFE